MMDLHNALDFVRHWEGGWSDDPDDRGGKTKYGISKSAHPDVDIESLTWEQAKVIYETEYWRRFGCDRMPDRVNVVLFDAAVNHGGTTAVTLLQEIVGAHMDGIVGVRTIERVCAANAPARRLIARRLAYYEAIIADRPSQAKFRDGWYNRMVSLGMYITDPISTAWRFA